LTDDEIYLSALTIDKLMDRIYGIFDS